MKMNSKRVRVISGFYSRSRDYCSKHGISPLRIIHGVESIRGLRGETLMVLPCALERDDYEQIKIIAIAQQFNLVHVRETI